jgi:hypothetical protein
MPSDDSRITSRQVSIATWIERALWVAFLAPGVALWLWRLTRTW